MALHKHKRTAVGIQPISSGRGKGLVRKPTTVGRKRVTLKRKIV